MPRYFFHTQDGHFAYDAAGTDLADSASARIEAVRLAGSLLAIRQQSLWETTYWRLIVTDEQRLVVFTIDVNTAIGVAGSPWPYLMA